MWYDFAQFCYRPYEGNNAGQELSPTNHIAILQRAHCDMKHSALPYYVFQRIAYIHHAMRFYTILGFDTILGNAIRRYRNIHCRWTPHRTTLNSNVFTTTMTSSSLVRSNLCKIRDDHWSIQSQSDANGRPANEHPNRCWCSRAGALSVNST